LPSRGAAIPRTHPVTRSGVKRDRYTKGDSDSRCCLATFEHGTLRENNTRSTCCRTATSSREWLTADPPTAKVRAGR
jgi:hypothetical protein